MKHVRCEVFLEGGGRCRRKRLGGIKTHLCRAHAHAKLQAALAKEELRDLATELCCEVGDPGGARSVAFDAVSSGIYRQLYAANERLQSALVACSSPGGVDPDAEVANG